MFPESVYLWVLMVGILLVCAGLGLAIAKCFKIVASESSPPEGVIDVLKGIVRGSNELIYVALGTLLVVAALYETRRLEVTGLPIDLCTPMLRAPQRADGGVSDGVRSAISVLNSLVDKKPIDENTKDALVDALVNPLAANGDLALTMRDAVLRSFLPTADVDLWCRVDQGKLDLASLSPTQKRMFNKVQALRDAKWP